jgi:hypothetical protein
MGKKRDIPFPRPKAAPVKKGEPHPQHTENEVKQQAPKQVQVNHTVRLPTANRRGS